MVKKKQALQENIMVEKWTLLRRTSLRALAAKAQFSQDTRVVEDHMQPVDAAIANVSLFKCLQRRVAPKARQETRTDKQKNDVFG